MTPGDIASNDRERLLNYSDSSDINNRSPFSGDGDEVKVYKKRWYILAMFFLLCVGQGIMYNSWAPIQSTARAVYKWDSFMIDLMPALGCIAPCFTIVPLGWLMDVKGLRNSVLLAAGCQFLGATLRCIPATGNWFFSTFLICCGQTLSGLVAPIPLSGGVLLSATWFPSNQRTISTAIVMAGGFFGGASSFLIGPFLVDDVGSMGIPIQDNNYVLTSLQRQRYYDQIHALFVTEAGLMAILFLGVFLHFPDRPPKPPSRSSGIERVDFKGSLTKLIRNSNFLLLALLYGVSCGVYSGWCSVLDQNLSEFGVGQTFAGWLGFIAVISGAFSGIFFSLFAGHFSSYLKEFLILFMALATVSILIMCLIFSKVIPFHTLLLCVIFGFTGFFVNGALPFFFELGAEMAYPVAEGITSSVIKFTDYFLQALFLIVSMGHFGAKWMTWVTMATCAVTTLLLFLVKEKYNRLIIDKKQTVLPD